MLVLSVKNITSIYSRLQFGYTLLSKSCHVGLTIQHVLNPLYPHSFVTFISAFKFNYPVTSFYPKVSPLLSVLLPLSSCPCWDVMVDSRDYTCMHNIAWFRGQGLGNKINCFVNMGTVFFLHFFFFVNVPAICLLFILATTYYPSQRISD